MSIYRFFLLTILIASAVAFTIFGYLYRSVSHHEKNGVLLGSELVIVAFELLASYFIYSV